MSKVSSVLTSSLYEKHTKGFLKFINASPSPFHAVKNIKERLHENGFLELKERDSWNGKLEKNGKYYFTRNQSTIVAFAVGEKFEPGNGFSMVAAHTDSPCLKVKPISKKEKVGYLQVGVQLYGGGLWHTWFDRDLGLAGRVVTQNKDGGLQSHLVHIKRPILRVPTLAIHLDRGVNEKLEFNKEDKLLPVLATVNERLNSEPSSSTSHHPELLSLLSQELSVEAESILDIELCLFDTQESCTGGINNEFIFSARLDNLMMSYTTVEGLIDSLDKHPLNEDPNVRLMCLYDNEEVGSASAYGADSLLTESTMRRIQAAVSKDAHTTAFEEGIAKSYLISADMAHAIHPNYSDKHESNHQPKIHGGVVIKHNANQRYATTSATSAILKHIAERLSLPLQEFVVRNDCACGSTIGPILSSKLGLQTIDIGCPQLSMHSIREMAGVQDLAHAIKLFEEFYGCFPRVLSKFQVD
ncbi:aspartyl aminopeptidase [Neoconidiobolus thromboides FSU 785]|nr:aspartyl aminopeptidase [Neoconidiobolus thromboides FSU 785]